MSAVLVLVGLAFAAAAVFVTFAVFALLLKFAFKLLLLPLLLIKWLVVSLVMLIVGPILFVVGVIAAVAFGLVMALPLLPFAAIAALVWVIVRGENAQLRNSAIPN